MHFNSTVFVIFLACLLVLWWTTADKARKRILFAGSLVFYGYWFPPFVLLLLTSGVIDYIVALKLGAESGSRKRLVTISVIANLSILFIFKYLGLFEQAVTLFATTFGWTYAPWHHALILPMGISFYTFQSMSYTLDVYRGDLKPSRDPVDFFLYLSFFPQLVAGPIVRARDFLPQIAGVRAPSESDIRFAIHRICRGYFLKVVIADNIAEPANRIFAATYTELDLISAWCGAAFFAIQIFCDFAGYSDIAVGIGRLFGFRINENFNAPYTATSLTDFWRRWHISLSTWFRDYVYLPLGGSRTKALRAYVNVAIVFLVSGLWHGANWTFVLWGGLHGAGVIAEKLARRHLPLTAGLPVLAKRGLTLAVVLLFWVPFRCPSIPDVFVYWHSMLLGSVTLDVLSQPKGLFYAALFAAFWFIETRTASLRFGHVQKTAVALTYFVFLFLMPGPPSDFVYFRF